MTDRNWLSVVDDLDGHEEHGFPAPGSEPIGDVHAVVILADGSATVLHPDGCDVDYCHVWRIVHEHDGLVPVAGHPAPPSKPGVYLCRRWFRCGGTSPNHAYEWDECLDWPHISPEVTP